MMPIVILVAAIVLLDIASSLWSADSRDTHPVLAG
jgi:hypothetical protein